MEDLTITGYIAKFRATKNISFLVKAAIATLRQRRAGELIYGAYCDLFFRPSPIQNSNGNHPTGRILSENGFLSCDKINLSRERLIKLWGRDFKVHSLPHDFEWARGESVVQDRKYLILGEYGHHFARVACVTRDSCVVNNYYDEVPGVRHIHSIIKYGDSGEFLVATGDTCKFLDLWVADDGRPSFVKRMKRRLAGYTASIRVRGRYYFGTDFSNRPNYIETLEGKKYFFPEKSYRMFVVAFYSFLDRYIVAINCDMLQFGDRKTLSIFDVIREEFIFCDYLDLILKERG